MSQRQLTLMAAIRLRSVPRTLERPLAPFAVRTCPVIQMAHMLAFPHLPPPHPHPPLLRALQGLLQPGRRLLGCIETNRRNWSTHKVAKEVQEFDKVVEHTRWFPLLVNGSLK